MASRDPWSRPTIEDLRSILESFGQAATATNLRTAERIELHVPAELTTARGNTISAITREISRGGVGLLHRGSITPGPCTLRMASESREYTYQIVLDWCIPCDQGMFMSGGRFEQNMEA